MIEDEISIAVPGNVERQNTFSSSVTKSKSNNGSHNKSLKNSKSATNMHAQLDKRDSKQKITSETNIILKQSSDEQLIDHESDRLHQDDFKINANPNQLCSNGNTFQIEQHARALISNTITQESRRNKKSNSKQYMNTPQYISVIQNRVEQKEDIEGLQEDVFGTYEQQGTQNKPNTYLGLILKNILAITISILITIFVLNSSIQSLEGIFETLVLSACLATSLIVQEHWIKLVFALLALSFIGIIRIQV